MNNFVECLVQSDNNDQLTTTIHLIVALFCFQNETAAQFIN